MDETQSNPGSRGLPTLTLEAAWEWERAVSGGAPLATLLAGTIAQRRWFGAKTAGVRGLEILESVAFGDARLLITRVELADGPSQLYQIPLAFCEGSKAEALLREGSSTLWAKVELPGPGVGVVYDALADASFCARLLELFDSQTSLTGATGQIAAQQSSEFRRLRGRMGEALAAQILAREQSNTSVIYGQRLILKVFRRVEQGVNPDFEITERLTLCGYRNAAPVVGVLEYRRAGEEPWSLGMLQAFVPNSGDAWRDTLARLEDYLSELGGAPSAGKSAARESLIDAARRPIPANVRAALADFLGSAELLARRTAEMHLALAVDDGEPAFAPEPLTPDDWRSTCARAAEMTRDTFASLRKHLPDLPSETSAQAAAVLALEPAMLKRFERAAAQAVTANKIRCHGDFHLGQVLVTDDDFVMIDFEGEPARPLELRRQKQLALRDVAGMIRSFHYAACSAAAGVKAQQPANAARIEELAAGWYFWTSVGFWATYRKTAGSATFIPADDEELERVLAVCLLEKAIYELRYELNHRPDWVYLPLTALADLAGK